MDVKVTIPEDIAEALLSTQTSLERSAIEGLAAEGYRSCVLSESQLMRLLNLPSRFAVHAWLHEHKIAYRYTEADLASVSASLSELGLQ